MRISALEELPKLPNLKLAVVGHVEWVTFFDVDQFPQPGVIGHANQLLEEPAGGGAVVAVQLARLVAQPVHLITALGRDEFGEKSFQRLQQLGLNLSVAWRNQPTRRAISLVDSNGERAITVAGERLQPSANDDLAWDDLASCDGVFVTAADAPALHHCRKAGVMAATPRVRLTTLKQAAIQLDLLIGSGLDAGEHVPDGALLPAPRLRIATSGAMGGQAWPGGRYRAVPLQSPLVDAYGCGDSFAAGVTAGLAAGWNAEQAISLGAHCGAKCAIHFGPYANDPREFHRN
ncbi:MAG: PfkB family carbohydrate kinase [Prochlorococcus sp.]